MRVPVNHPMPLMRLRPHAHRVMADCQFVLVETELVNIPRPVEHIRQFFVLLNYVVMIAPYEGVPSVQPVEYSHTLFDVERAPEQVARVNRQIALRIGHLFIVSLDHPFCHRIDVRKRAILHPADEVMPVVLVARDEDVAHKFIGDVLFQGVPEPATADAYACAANAFGFSVVAFMVSVSRRSGPQRSGLSNAFVTPIDSVTPPSK